MPKTFSLRHFGFLLALVTVAAVVYLLYPRQAHPLKAMPAQSALVLECNGLLKARQLLQQLPAPEWEAIGRSACFQTCFADIEAALSLFKPHPDLLRQLAKSPAAAAFTLHPADSLHPLLVVCLPETIDLEKLLSSHRNTKHIFHEHTIWQTQVRPGQTLAFAVADQYLLFSRQASLVESALAQLEQGEQWWTARPLANELTEAPLRFHLRPSVWVEQLRAHLYTGTQALPDLFSRQVEWIGMAWDGSRLDCLMETKGFGATWANASQATGHASDQILPDNLVFALRSGIKHKSAFFDGLSTPLLPDFNQYVLPWVGDEVIFAVTEPLSEQLHSDKLWLLAVADSAAAIRQLRDYGASHGLVPESSGQYQMFELLGFQQGALLEPLTGKDEAFRNPVCTMLEGYVVFAADLASMQVFLDKYLVGKTLGAREDYLALQSQISEKSNLQILLNTQYLEPLLQAIGRIRPEAAEQSLGWLSASIHAEGPGKNRIFWNNQTFTQTTPTAEMRWKTRLSAKVATRPWVATLHSSRAAVLAQDRQGKLYCLNAHDGQLLWTRSFPEQILSDIQAVDYFKSGHNCLMFNTKSAVYLLDEEGRDVQGFPFFLPETTTLPITVVDFGQDHAYSFFAVCNNGRCYGFDPLRRPIRGWNGVEIPGKVLCPLLHFPHAGKDYLMVLTDQGQLTAYGKDGRLLFPVLSWNGVFQEPLWVDSRAEFPEIYATSVAGQVYRCDLKGNWKEIALGRSGGLMRIGQLRPDAPAEWAQWDHKQLRMGQFSPEGYRVLSTIKAPGLASHLQITPDAQLAATDTLGKRLWLFDANGRLQSGFPLGGALPFTLFQQGKLKLLVTGNEEEIWVYRV